MSLALSDLFSSRIGDLHAPEQDREREFRFVCIRSYSLDPSQKMACKEVCYEAGVRIAFRFGQRLGVTLLGLDRTASFKTELLFALAHKHSQGSGTPFEASLFQFWDDFRDVTLQAAFYDRFAPLLRHQAADLTDLPESRTLG
jgi:hypothetical protein